MSVAQEIKNRLDIVDYLGRFVPDLKKAGRYYKACCPFHSEKTPSFVVNPDNQSWRCFGSCAEGGDVLSFAMKYHGWSFSDTVTELGRLVGVEVTQRTPEQREQDAHKARLIGLLKTASEYYHDHLMSHQEDAQMVREYALTKRGFTLETLTRYQIGYAPKGWDNMAKALIALGYSEQDILDAGLVSKNEEKQHIYDRFRHRLMIPIRDERGSVVGFGARALDPNDTPKYLNSPASALFDKSKLLFGLDVAKQAIRESETAVIVEGYMDALQAHQAGYLNVVAQMGTAMTETQLGLLVPRYAKKIVMALDADEAGQNAMRRSLEVARQTLEQDYTGRMSVEIRVLQIDNAKDPDDVLRETPDLWRGYVENALPVADFVIASELAHLSANASYPERQAIAKRILPILTATESNWYRRENVQKLALRLKIDETDLLHWADTLQKERGKRDKNHPEQQPVSAKPVEKESDMPPKSASPAMEGQFPVASYDEEGYPIAPSEEPPPLNWDTLEAPPELQVSESLAYVPVVRKPAPTSAEIKTLQTRHMSRSAEAFCLRTLLQAGDWLYEVNRKFRQLLATQPEFRDHPLGELMQDDFSQADLRALFLLLLESHQQEEMDWLLYLEQHADSALQQVMVELLVDENTLVLRHLQDKLTPDTKDVLSQLSKHRSLERDRRDESLRRLIEIRKHRLHRELQELRFLVHEATEIKDNETLARLLKITQETMRALALFQTDMPVYKKK